MLRDKLAFRLIMFMVLCFLLLPLAQAQSTTATLSGTVEDERGAVIPGATITVLNAGTGLERQATTNDEGYFAIPLLPPSRYKLRVERHGFAPVELPEVVLNINDQRALQIQLRVGELTGAVTVDSSASGVEVDPSVGTVVNRQFVENLPLNGRSFQSLITLSPGVVLTKADFTAPGQFSVNGQRSSANYFTVDGVSANIGAPTGIYAGPNGGGALPGFTVFGGTNNLVSVDGLQEFKILTSTYAPEFGRTPGAQVSMVTRSGTNEFHGSLFEYFRNDALDANDWFANSRGLPKPALRQNDFGGVVGGPILLPRFGEGGRQPWYNGRNRTFFFFSYEGLRLRQPLVGITDVPSRSARASATASPAILQLLNAFPLPTGADRPNGFAEFAASFSNPTKLNATSIRIDHTLSDRLAIFGRYNYAPSDTHTRAGAGNSSLNTTLNQLFVTTTITGGATYIITPKITDELRLNYSSNRSDAFLDLDAFGGAVVPPDSFLFPSFTSRAQDSINVNLEGGRNASLFVGKAAANKQRQFNIVNNLSLVSGPHLIKLGVDYRRLSPILSLRNYVQFVDFNGITNTTNGALSGIAQQVEIDNNTGPQIPILHNLSVYGQDLWKITSRLNLTYGLRWELNPPPREAHGNEAYAITGDLQQPASVEFAPRGTPLWKTTFNNFAPRIGLSYQLSKSPGRETVLRGGFGVFYDLATGTVTTAYAGSWPFASHRFLNNTPFPISPANATPLPVTTAPPTTTPITIIDPHLKLPYTYQWNFSAEQSLGANQTITATYVAALGRRLLRQSFVSYGISTTFTNQDFKDFVYFTSNEAKSNYQALQLQFQRRLSRGLQALASYTWGHSIDTASTDSPLEFTGPQGVINVDQDRGPSDFDVRHTLTGAVTYNIPPPPLGRVGKAIFGNWAIDGIFNARSATPINVLLASITDRLGFFQLRPNLIQGVPLYLPDPSIGGRRRINPDAFSLPAPGQQGSLGRNSVRGFPLTQVDLAVRRQFKFSERVNLQFRAEAFNILNHPNFGDPVATSSVWGTDLPDFGLFFPNTSFGQSTSMLGRRLGSGGALGGFNPLYQVGGPRSIQLSLRLAF
jgi:hypothetical protein